jgi:hypothetical protein
LEKLYNCIVVLQAVFMCKDLTGLSCSKVLFLRVVCAVVCGTALEDMCFYCLHNFLQKNTVGGVLCMDLLWKL